MGYSLFTQIYMSNTCENCWPCRGKERAHRLRQTNKRWILLAPMTANTETASDLDIEEKLLFFFKDIRGGDWSHKGWWNHEKQPVA